VCLIRVAPGLSPFHCLQFSTLFIRSVRVRRFETLSQQDLIQFLSVATVCGMIWWASLLFWLGWCPC
jgi:hypothetical protein